MNQEQGEKLGSVEESFTLNANGTDEFSADHAPAIRIEIVNALGGKKNKIGYVVAVEFWRVDQPDPDPVVPVDGEAWRQSMGGAWMLAWMLAKNAIYDAQAHAIDHDNTSEAITIAAFRGVLGERLQEKRDQIDEKDVIRFEWFRGTDLIIALRTLARRFETIDRLTTIGFRHRFSSLGNEWTSGVNERNEPRPLVAKVEKCSGDKASAARGALGYAPEFVVTVCGSAWGAGDEQEKFLALHGVLSQIKWDGEKDRAFICAPVATSPETLYEAAALGFLSDEEKRRVEMAIRGAIDGGKQLDVFGVKGLDVNDGDTSPEALARRANNALQAYLGATRDETHFEARNSATLALAAFKANSK